MKSLLTAPGTVDLLEENNKNSSSPLFADEETEEKDDCYRYSEEEDNKSDMNNLKTATSVTTMDDSPQSQMTALFDDFMTYGSVGLHIVDRTGIILWANKAELDLLGYDESEYIGKPISDFHANQSKLNEILGILLSGAKVKSLIAPIRCKDGHTEYMEINSSMRQDKNGMCTTTRCFSVCVTDRILREEAQLEALARKKEAEIIREETKKKTDFLRKLCHELRNPLAGITGNLELLLEELTAADAVPPPEEGSDGTSSSAVTETVTHKATNEKVGESGTAAAAETTTALVPSSPSSPAQASPVVDPTSSHTTPAKTTSTAQDQLAYVRQRLKSALEYAESAQMAAEHQMLVVNDTLSLSKLESTGFDFHPKPVDFANVLASVTAILGVKAKEKGLDIHVELSEDARYVKTDIVWVKQVLINLLSNSLKFTQHGHVSINVKALLKNEDKNDDNNDESTITLEITIRDTGIGMTQQERNNLFGIFSQANDMISTNYGGSGLGLYIVKQVLDHLGGSIHVKSKQGAGSTFVFTLPCGVLTPLERASLPASASSSSLPLSSKQQQQQPLSPSTSTCTKKQERQRSLDALQPLKSAQGTRVLVVDDIEVNRKILASYLRKKGYVYEVAVNGQIGLDLHRQNPFDIILTDIDMPVMSGNEMTLIIRREEQEAAAKSTSDDGRSSFCCLKRPPVPIIGISGNVFQQDLEAAERAGINEFMCKPFKFSVLEDTMLKLLEPGAAGAAAPVSRT